MRPSHAAVIVVAALAGCEVEPDPDPDPDPLEAPLVERCESMLRCAYDECLEEISAATGCLLTEPNCPEPDKSQRLAARTTCLDGCNLTHCTPNSVYFECDDPSEQQIIQQAENLEYDGWIEESCAAIEDSAG